MDCLALCDYFIYCFVISPLFRSVPSAIFSAQNVELSHECLFMEATRGGNEYFTLILCTCPLVL